MKFREMMEWNHPDDTLFRPEVTLKEIYTEEHKVSKILLDDPAFEHLEGIADDCSLMVEALLEGVAEQAADLSNSEKTTLYVFVNHALLMGMSQSTKIGAKAASLVTMEKILKSFEML